MKLNLWNHIRTERTARPDACVFAKSHTGHTATINYPRLLEDGIYFEDVCIMSYRRIKEISFEELPPNPLPRGAGTDIILNPHMNNDEA